MACSEDVQMSPKSLNINTAVVTARGGCEVVAGGVDVHRVSTRNHTNTPFEIRIDSRCTTDNLLYYDTAGSHVNFWKPQPFIARSKPPGWGRGGPREDSRSAPLTTTKLSISEEIEVDLGWSVPGSETGNSETVRLPVSTR